MNGAPPPESTGRQADPSTRDPAKKSRTRRLSASKAHWFERLPDKATILNTCLLGTLAVDALAALALAVGDLGYVKTIFDSVGVAFLFAIAGANVLAIGLLLYDVASWAAAAFIAQALILGLALYIMWVAYYKSAQLNLYVMCIAAVIALLAGVWLIALARRALQQLQQFTKTAAILTLVVPLAGAGQFYIQNSYIPHTSEPLVDVSVELSPQSKSPELSPETKLPQTIHLSAKVTVHNRGSVRVNVAAALMRVTVFPPPPPPSQQQQPPEQQQQPKPQPSHPESAFGCRVRDAFAKWCQMLDGVDLSGGNLETEFRADSTPPVNKNLLYVGLFMHPYRYLLPGETDAFQKEVDIEPAIVGRARLSVSAVFLTERSIKDNRACWNTQSTGETEPDIFSIEVNIPKHDILDQKRLPIIDRRMQANYVCRDYEFAPQNIVDRLIGNQGVFRVQIMLNDPQHPGSEYPQIQYHYCLLDTQDSCRDHRAGDIVEKLHNRNPSGYIDLSAEYAPGDPVKAGDRG